MKNFDFFKNIFANLNGGSFISLDTLTNVLDSALEGASKNPNSKRVTKLVKGSQVMVFQNKTTNAYDNMVKRRLVAEGKNPESFSLSPRSWGVRIENTPFIKHTPKGETEEKYYLEVIFLKAKSPEYFLDKKPICKEEVGLKDNKAEGEQGGLTDKVIIRTISIESIVGLTVDKVHYDIRK